MSDPQPHLGFFRVAWATFTSPEAATAALSTIQAAHNKSLIAGGEKKAEAAAEADEAKKEPVEGESAAASENDTEMTTAQPVATPVEETAAQPVSPYSIGAYDLTHPGLLFIRLESIEVRVRAAPACTSAPSRIRRDLETALQAVEVLEKQLVATAESEGEGEASGGEKGSAVIREKRSAWEKEVEQRKEAESLDDVAYERARDDVVS